MLLRGSTCSQPVQDALNDLYQLRRPFAKKFTKRNENIHPFDETCPSLEFFSQKNDASLLVFGSHTKKRPHTVTLVRMFDHKILDQAELLLDRDTYRPMEGFEGKKPGVGLRPMVLFAGEGWESPVANKLTVAKSLLTDFFANREQMDKVDVEGLQYIVSLTAGETPASEDELPQIHLRAYLIRTKKSGQKLPRVEVEEMGPRMDFRIGRIREADESVMRDAMKKAKTSEERTKKNVQTDVVGHQVGRIHLGKQDLSKLTTRRVKALKKRGREEVDGQDDIAQNSEEEQGGERKKKKL